jgi:choline-sulfatase
MLGERGLWYKMSFFEWSARVPMLFYAPERFAPRRVAHPVSLVDVLPTLVQIGNGGLAPEYVENLDGSSLLPWLEGQDVAEPAPVYGEMLGEGAISPVLMIRRERFKYVFSQRDPEQLFDLTADPHELNNLAGQEMYEQVRAGFYEELMTAWNPTELHQAVIDSQRRRRFLAQSLRKGRLTSWDFQPFQDASQQYMRNHLDLNELEKSSRFPSPSVPPPDSPGG